MDGRTHIKQGIVCCLFRVSTATVKCPIDHGLIGLPVCFVAKTEKVLKVVASRIPVETVISINCNSKAQSCAISWENNVRHACAGGTSGFVEGVVEESRLSLRNERSLTFAREAWS